MPSILVTLRTFHLDRSRLKDLASENILSMLVTWDTSHSPIDTCGPVEQSPTGDRLRHASTAAMRFSLVCGKKHIPFAMDPGELLNMFAFCAFESIHASPHSTCLKDVAPLNIDLMSMTWSTFHLDKSWLQDSAPLNICRMLVTCPTFHLDKSWLNDLAFRNIFFMMVTWPTSHLDRSPLKSLA